MNNCMNCNSHDFKRILQNRDDFEYGCSEKLDYYKCITCGHISVYPVPSLEQISTFYSSYTTHNIYKSSLISKLIDDITKYKKKQELKNTFKNNNLKDVKILDFGSGNGNFLDLLSQLNIKNIYGFDFDNKAVECSKQQGYECFTDFNDLKNNKYDYIFLNHVIEHLPEPKETIKNLIDLLSKNGKIILRTPNSNSLLAKFFKESWRGWETPRHLNIFNNNSIEMFNDLSEKFEVNNISTSNKMFIGIYIGSLNSNKFNLKFIKKIVQLSSLFFLLFAYLINLLSKNSGEELCFEISSIVGEK